MCTREVHVHACTCALPPTSGSLLSKNLRTCMWVQFLQKKEEKERKKKVPCDGIDEYM